MFCSACGQSIPDGAAFCGHCGAPQAKPADGSTASSAAPQQSVPPFPQQSVPPFPQQPIPAAPVYPQQPAYAPPGGSAAPAAPNAWAANPAYGPGLIGFTNRIGDPAFEKYQKAQNRYAFIFAGVLAAIALIGMPVYGNLSGEVEFPQSLGIGAVLAAMFLLIATGQMLKKRWDSTWDGTVVHKESQRKRRVGNTQSIARRHYTEYIYVVQRENGRKYRHRTVDRPGLYGYYQEGERVRHHKGFLYYEKYDKSHDEQMPCIACLTMNPAGEDRCRRCKCPLPKA